MDRTEVIAGGCVIIAVGCVIVMAIGVLCGVVAFYGTIVWAIVKIVGILTQLANLVG
jgi:hypothetical protein